MTCHASRAIMPAVITSLRTSFEWLRRQTPQSLLELLVEWLRWLWRTILQIAFRSDDDHIYMLSAGIAFNIITSLVPTVLVILYVLGYILDSQSVVAQLNEYASSLIVSGEYRADIIDAIRTQVDNIVSNRGIAGLLGIIGVLWSSSALASAIRVAVNKVLRCRERQNFLIYKLYDIVGIMILGLLVFLSIVTGPLLGIVRSFTENVANQLPFDLIGFDWLLGEITIGVLNLLIFWAIFRFVPYQRQDKIVIVVGTLVSAGLWEGARYLFGFYLVEFGTIGRVYGGFAYFAAAALWIYFSALVFLVGAEIAYHVKQSAWNARRTFERVADTGESG